MYDQHKDLYYKARLSSQHQEATRKFDELKQLFEAAQEQNKRERAELLRNLADNHDKRLAEEKTNFERSLNKQQEDAQKHYDELKAKMDNRRLILEQEMSLKLEELKKVSRNPSKSIVRS